MKFTKITVYFEKLMDSDDVKAMTSTQKAGYMWMLFHSINQKEKGYIPNNDKLLFIASSLSVDEWRESKEVLLNKFTLCDKGYYNPVMLEEVNKEVQLRLKKSNAGKASKTKKIKSPVQSPVVTPVQSPVQTPVVTPVKIHHLPDNKRIDTDLNGTSKPHSPENQTNVKKHKLQLYIENPRAHLDSVRKIKNQLTYDQCVSLVGELSDPTDMGKPFTTKLVKEKLFKMEIHEGIEKKPSVFSVLRVWCENELAGKVYGKAK